MTVGSSRWFLQILVWREAGSVAALWHLRVKTQGAVFHYLLGAVSAAATSLYVTSSAPLLMMKIRTGKKGH
jgi:hypothetical protein